MDNMDMGKLLQMLSSVNKKDLEKSIAKANEILKNNDKQEIMDEINKFRNQG